MANVYNINPISITSVDNTSYKSRVLTQLGAFVPLLITKVYWENPANVGDTFVIEDPQTGIVLAQGICAVAKQAVILDWVSHPKQWRDFTIPQISSGILYIYLI